MTAQNKIAQQIQLLRAKHGWTQDQLADRLNVSKQSVSNWETGQKSPRMGALQKMADLFNVSIGYITDGDATDETIDLKISSAVAKLSNDRKQNVYTFVQHQLDDQENNHIYKMPEVLAAHADDMDREYTDDDIKDISSFLHERIDKYKKNNGE